MSKKAPKSLILGLPSKGRLKEQCHDYLATRGLNLVSLGSERTYQAKIDGLDHIDVRLMGPSDIAKGLLDGSLHMGVTGEDLIRESHSSADDVVGFAARLGFGRADVVVAVPDGWVDVTSMADLADVAADMRRDLGRRFRIATKYTNLAAAFLTKHHVVDALLVDSAGATEAAPAAGSADAIVDITTTGATLVANGLKMLDDGLILASEACLIRSKLALWSPQLEAIAQTLKA